MNREDKFWDGNLKDAIDLLGMCIPGTSRPGDSAFMASQRLCCRNLLCNVFSRALRVENIPMTATTQESREADGPGVDEFDTFSASLGRSRLKKVLHSVEFSPRDGEARVPRIDALRLNASWIHSQGPFRFEATENLDDHLTITADRRILFYFKMQNFAALYCCGKVLAALRGRLIFF